MSPGTFGYHFCTDVCCLVLLGIIFIQRYVVWCFWVSFSYRGMSSGALGYRLPTEVCHLVLLLGIVSVQRYVICAFGYRFCTEVCCPVLLGRFP